MNPFTVTAPWTQEEIESPTDLNRTSAVEGGAVFIKGVNRVNLGAHLMMITIIEEVLRQRPRGGLALAPGAGPNDQRGLVARPRRNLRRLPAVGGWANAVARRLPDVMLERIPQVFDHQVDLVLDAPGFLYSDQWGATAMAHAARDLEGLSRSGARIILMPQAFGPFTDPHCAHWMRRILEVVSLAVARDAASHAHLLGVAGERLGRRVVRGPDLTFGHRLRAEPHPAARDQVLIVPNYRMVSESDETRRAGYHRVLTDLIARLEARGETVAFLIHGEEGDRVIAQELNAKRAQPLPVLEVRDPIDGKRVVAGARFMIASRFHAVLAAFNTGVPCIGLGWSHKYAELFDEFGLPGLYLSDWSAPAVELTLGRLESAAQRAAVSERLTAGVEERRAELAEMWRQVWRIAGEEA